MVSGPFIKPSGPYFLSHSVGLQPAAARGAIDRLFLDPWAAGDGGTWDHWLAASDAFRAAIAPLIGAKADDICPQTNISSALTKLLFSLPAEPRRRKIVLSEEDFPTVGFVLAEARRLGLSPVFLKSGAHLADPDAWSEAFSDETHLVHITHVFSNLGLKTPVAEIVARARAKGVISVVDVAQSAGAVDVAADGWGADFLTGTSVKYLCGGPGACFLWVNPLIAPKCAPLDVGWFSHENPFEFDIGQFRYAEGARRFWGGTPSIAPLAVAVAGAEIIGRTGVDRVASHNQALIARLVAAVPETSILSHVRTGERGCAVIIRPQRMAEAAAALAEAKIAHDARIGGLRFSAHLYTDEGDIDRLIATLAPFF